MGLAEQATRPFGIVGVGYNADESIASTDPESIYPNIVSQLKAQGFIKTLSYSLWLNDLGMCIIHLRHALSLTWIRFLDRVNPVRRR